MALWNIVSRLFVRLIFSGSKFNCPFISDPFYCFIIIFTKARCTSLYHFNVIDEYIGVQMINIQDVGEKKLCRQILKYVVVTNKGCVLRMLTMAEMIMMSVNAIIISYSMPMWMCTWGKQVFSANVNSQMIIMIL